MTWTHPTGKAPKTVALVCLGPSRAAHAGACLEPDLSDALDGVEETWTLNRGIGMVPHDLLFVMDHIQGEADKFPRYGAALWKHDRPIITSDNCEGWPAHVHRYPFRDVWNWNIQTLNPRHGDWFHNSVSYILNYAAFIGVREIRVFGADYSHHSSGVVEDGHPNVAYWVGKLEAAGLTVTVPSTSSFLNSNQRHWIYGYREDPRVIRAARATFRALTGQDLGEDLESGERQVAPTVEAIQPDHVNRYEWAARRLKNLGAGSVIDLGAGVGYGSAVLADAGLEVLSIERSSESVQYGALHYPRPNVRRVCADLSTGLSIESDFSTAVCFELIEHLRDPAPLLRAIPAGTLLASVPNESVIPWSPRVAPFHHRHYTAAQFDALLEACGWDVVDWYGQTSPLSRVIPWQEDCRTIIVEAVRQGRF